MTVAQLLLDKVYPKRALCVGCGSKVGQEQDWMCEECRALLAKSALGARHDPKLDGMAAAYGYHGPAGGAVRRLKFSGMTAMVGWMADDMVRAEARIEPTGAEWIVPVPMHPKRRRRRGFNHAEVLARALSERMELPCENALIRTRNTVQQAILDDEARRTNLKDAFRCVGDVDGKRILLVDDVYTTGTTARECAKALREGGAKCVYLIVYAMSGN